VAATVRVVDAGSAPSPQAARTSTTRPAGAMLPAVMSEPLRFAAMHMRMDHAVRMQWLCQPPRPGRPVAPPGADL
jgi:hypothetical protein